MKKESFLADFMLILHSCFVQQVSNCHYWLSAYNLCLTAIRQDTRASWHFCSCELPFCSDAWVLLHCLNVQPSSQMKFEHFSMTFVWYEMAPNML